MPLTTTPSNALALTELGALTLPGAEISAFDAATKTLWVTSLTGLRVLDFSNPASPTVIQTITFTGTPGSSNDVNSVAIKNGIVAVAVNASTATSNGKVFLFDTAGTLLNTIDVGAVPDNLVFTPDGTKILVANEGESTIEPGAQLAVNPVGSISIIDISGGAAAATVETAGFDSYDSQAASLIASGVRLFTSVPAFSSAGTTVAQDLEPEYIAISPDGTKALVTLQEANSIAIVDIASATVTGIVPLGLKDFSTLAFDGSDRDGTSNAPLINLQTGRPVFGIYQPDAIASYTAANGQVYYVIANEGDDRDDFLAPNETTSVGNNSYDLDNTIFSNETFLKSTAGIGRLTVSNAPGLRGDTDNDGDIDQIITYGGRSFSILDANGNLIFDSGSHIDVTIAALSPLNFDDTRSDNKGSEPEGVTTAVIGGKVYAFIGLERFAGTMVYDVTNPTDPSFVTFASSPAAFTSGSTTGTGFGSGNTAFQRPEGGVFISAADSPTGKALYVVSNEGTGTVGPNVASIVTYEVNAAPVINSNGGGATATAYVAENSTAVTTVAATDIDAGTTIAYSITGGADAGKFAIDAATGALTFVNAPDFEAPTDAGTNNVYDVVVTASDGTLTDSQTLAVRVTSIPDSASYVLPTVSNVSITPIATVGDAFGFKPDGTPYRMVGIPDGLGAFDNGDGTITVLMNHEIVGDTYNLSGQQVGTGQGIVRAHGGNGAFVSEWILNKSDLSVVSVQDAITTVRLWDRFDTDSDGDANVDWLAGSPFSISRLCSADLAPVSAYQWVDTRGTVDTSDDVTYGTAERIFLTGEEFSPSRDNPATAGVNEEILGGREFAYVATGADKGVAFELAHFGYFAWENAISSPFAQKKTINISLDDGLNGQLYVYVGEKQTTGNAVEKAGLTDGLMYGIKVTNLLANSGNESDALAANGRFELALEDGPKSPGGDISLLTGIELDDLSESKGVTSFLRPEDGQFDPTNPNVFWFVTTASFGGQSRLYKLTFDDITNPETGGTIEAVLSSSDLPVNSTVGPRMMDNMTVNSDGKIIIQEDVGGNAHLGRVLQYDPVTDKLVVIATHDAARFISGAPGFITQDEETSGVIEISDLLGNTGGDKTYLFVDQVHNNLRVSDPELVEGGQFGALRVTNNAPVISSNGAGTNATVYVAENSTAVTTVVASDDLIDTVTYSVTGGADAGKFAIDAATGALTFVNAPNFEAPIDAGTNNVYDVVVTASDGTKTDSQTLAVEVTDGVDTFTGTAVRDNLTGTAGADIVLGLGGNDTLNGLGGNDTLDGGIGNDVMYGGLGDDIYFVDAANDVVIERENEGTDTVFSANAAYRLSTNVENLTFTSTGAGANTGSGNALANVMTGAGGVDTLLGFEGNDTLSGMGGNDILNGGIGNDVLDGGMGVDTLVGGAGDDLYIVESTGDLVREVANEGYDLVESSATFTLSANVEDLTLTGSAAINGTGNSLANILTGNSAENILFGAGGDDTLLGMGGNDTLNGGTGVDTLTGGFGADTFLFSSLGSTADLVTDFSGIDGDKLAFSRAAFTGLGPVGGLGANAFANGTSALDASDRVIYDQATGNLYYDADGTGSRAQVLVATIGAPEAIPSLTFADFLIMA